MITVDVRVHVRLLAFATVEVESFAALFAEQLVGDHLAKHARRLHPVAELAREIGGDMVADIQSHFVDQPQRPHRHSEIQHALVDVLDARAALEQPAGLDEVRHEDAVHEKAGAVLAHDGELADLLHELHCAPHHVQGGLPPDDDLDELHLVNRIEEMNADHALGMLGGRADFADGKRGGVGRENCLRTRQFIKLREKLLLQIHLLDGGFDDDVRVGQRHVSGGRRDAVESGARLDLGERETLHALFIKPGDARQPLGHGLGIDVAQHDADVARAGPLSDARAHDARANHGDALHGSHLHLVVTGNPGEFLRTLLEEENADEILARLGMAKLKDRVALQGERFVDGERKAVGDDFERLEHGGVMSARLAQNLLLDLA